MAFPTCPTGCSTALDALPVFDFSECAPKINAAEIRYIYIGLPGNPFTDIKLATEWTARLLATNVGASKLVRMTVLGDKARHSGTVKEISGGRKVTLIREHLINATVDETSVANHEAFRKMECGGITLPIWYQTAGGQVFGGNAGILVSIDPGMVISRSSGDSIVWELALSWKARFTEEMALSPIA